MMKKNALVQEDWSFIEDITSVEGHFTSRVNSDREVVLSLVSVFVGYKIKGPY